MTTDSSDALGLMIFWDIIMVLVCLALYFIPAMIAYACGRRQRFAILILNLLSGWTFIGWVGALVWACLKDY